MTAGLEALAASQDAPSSLCGRVAAAGRVVGAGLNGFGREMRSMSNSFESNESEVERERRERVVR